VKKNSKKRVKNEHFSVSRGEAAKKGVKKSEKKDKIKNVKKTTKNFIKKNTKINDFLYIIQPLSTTQTKSDFNFSHWKISKVSRIGPSKGSKIPYGGGSNFFKRSLESTR